MKTFIQLFKFILIAEAAPASITLLTLAFTIFYWGPGIIVLGMAILMISVAGLAGLIIAYIRRKRTVSNRIISTGIFSFLIALALQGFQFYSSTPNKLKKVVLVKKLNDKFTATRGRLIFAGFEHEIYNLFRA